MIRFRSLSPLALLALGFAATSLPLAAAETSAAEARLRDALRATTLQLRDIQGQLAEAQTGRAAAEDNAKQLEARLAQVVKQGAADREDAARSLSELKARAAAQSGDLARLTRELEDTRASLRKTEATLAAAEKDRAALGSRVVELERMAEDRLQKNVALYKVGREVLDRYANFGLGDALKAKEPFVGLARVKMENLVQEYQDRLAEQKIKP